MKDLFKTSYELHCYNNHNDYPVAMVNTDEFLFEKLLSDQNSNIRNFSLIIILKSRQQVETTTIKPIIAIYNKNIWKVDYRLQRRYHGSYHINFTTNCSCNHHSIDYSGRLKKMLVKIKSN